MVLLPPAQRDPPAARYTASARLGLIWPTVKSSVKSGATEGFHMNFTVISCERAKSEISFTNPGTGSCGRDHELSHSQALRGGKQTPRVQVVCEFESVIRRAGICGRNRK